MAIKKMTYDAAFEELEKILEDIQSDNISIDHLASKVKRSKELLSFCKESLRKYQGDIVKINES
ncbi:MAG: exodeoxyribonuclease VII small subunit [Saprospiraceae bacterium]